MSGKKVSGNNIGPENYCKLYIAHQNSEEAQLFENNLPVDPKDILRIFLETSVMSEEHGLYERTETDTKANRMRNNLTV